MANCNKLFLDYNENLRVPSNKIEQLQKSKDHLRKKIKKHFKEHHPDYKPEFYIQGSYKMKTMILTKDDQCDLDDGVYFLREEGVSGTTLQKWLKEAVENATDSNPVHRKKCVRVLYKNDYHIDFPVYYFPEDKQHPQLAVKDESLEESDPKELVEWYSAQKDEKGQLNRIVKYLKGWGDNIREKMPSGLAMTILAATNIEFDERDDIALKDTLKNILDSLNHNFECVMPVVPNDDLFENYEDDKKDRFLQNLKDFVEDSETAVNEERNQLRSSKLWRKHLGDKFPLGEDEDTDKKEALLNKLTSSILSSDAYTQKDGSISRERTGVKNKPHRNFGGKE